jgi:hypothetical protein
MKYPKDKQLDYKRYIEDLMYQKSMYNSSYGSGKIDGIKESVEIGIKEGEKQAKLEIAKNLLDILDIETISLKTGLSIEDITNLKKE